MYCAEAEIEQIRKGCPNSNSYVCVPQNNKYRPEYCVPLQCSRKWHLRTVLRPLQAADPSFQGTNPTSRGESIQKTDATIEDSRGETLLHNRDRGAQRDSRARRVHAAVRNLRHRQDLRDGLASQFP